MSFNTYSVVNSTDDVDHSGTLGTGNIDLTGSVIEIVQKSVAPPCRSGGFRFLDVRIPKGAIIEEAYCEFYIYTSLFSDIDCVIYGIKDTYPLTFADVDGQRVLDRPRTNSNISFVQDTIPLGWNYSPNIKEIIQEIIDQPGWESRNPLGLLFIVEAGLPAKTCKIRSYDYDPNYAPRLVVSWRYPVYETSDFLDKISKFPRSVRTENPGFLEEIWKEVEFKKEETSTLEDKIVKNPEKKEEEIFSMIEEITKFPQIIKQEINNFTDSLSKESTIPKIEEFNLEDKYSRIVDYQRIKTESLDLSEKPSPPVTIVKGNVRASSGLASTFYLMYNLAPGTDRILVVEVGSVDLIPLSVTFGSESLTKLREDISEGSPRSSLWYLTDPSIEDGLIQVTFSGTVPVIVGALDYSNVETSDPWITHIGTTGSGSEEVSLDLSLPSVLVDIFCTWNGIISPYSEQYERWIEGGEINQLIAGGSDQRVSTGSSTMGWNNTGGYCALSVGALREKKPQFGLIKEFTKSQKEEISFFDPSIYLRKAWWLFESFQLTPFLSKLLPPRFLEEGFSMLDYWSKWRIRSRKLYEDLYLSDFWADPTNVDITAGISSTRETMQRKNFFAKGRFWVFYYNEGNLKYRSSIDGVNWGPKYTIATGLAWAQKFGVCTDEESIHYIRVVNENQAGYCYYRKGLLQTDGEISWVLPEQLALHIGGLTIYQFFRPVIALDSEGYPWIGLTTNDQAYDIKKMEVWRSGTKDGTWNTDLHEELSWGDENPGIAIHPLSERKLYATFVYFEEEGHLYGRLFDGTSWSPTERISLADQVYYEGGAHIHYAWSASANGDRVFVIYKGRNNNKLYYRERDPITNWGNELEFGDGDWPVLTALDNDHSFVSWILNNHIFYTIFTDGRRGGIEDWINEEIETIRHFAVSYDKPYQGKIGILYTRGNIPNAWYITFAWIGLRVKKISEALSISDYISWVWIYPQLLFETLGFEDFLSRIITQLRTYSEMLHLAPWIGGKISKTMKLIEEVRKETKKPLFGSILLNDLFGYLKKWGYEELLQLTDKLRVIKGQVRYFYEDLVLEEEIRLLKSLKIWIGSVIFYLRTLGRYRVKFIEKAFERYKAIFYEFHNRRKIQFIQNSRRTIVRFGEKLRRITIRLYRRLRKSTS